VNRKPDEWSHSLDFLIGEFETVSVVKVDEKSPADEAREAKTKKINASLAVKIMEGNARIKVLQKRLKK
jgi:hypothetical protein